MKSYDKYKRLVQIFSSIIMILSATSVYTVVWYRYISPFEQVWFARRGNWMMSALYAVLLMFFFHMYGGFRLGYLEKWNVVYSQILSLLIVNVITYFQISLLSYGFPMPMPFILLMVCDIIAVISWMTIWDMCYKRMFPPRRILLIYKNENGLSLSTKMKQRTDRYNLEEHISISEGMDKILSTVGKYEGVILCDIETSDRNTILKYCFENEIRIYMTPKISDIIVRSAEEMHIFDTPLLLSRNIGLTLEQQILKRIMDICFSVIMLCVLSPVMLIAAAAVKLYDKGPVIYKQKRLTIHGREFFVYKFRSMSTDAEKDGIARLASANDTRITPVGRIIRMCRIDELPQLFNVLEGSMSLVGPRPERPEIAKKYQQELPQFSARLKVKAGLTGYAQIYGKYNTTPYDKLKLDITYIQNFSLLMDLKILILTVKILFIKESTEGVSDEHQ